MQGYHAKTLHLIYKKPNILISQYTTLPTTQRKHTHAVTYKCYTELQYWETSDDREQVKMNLAQSNVWYIRINTVDNIFINFATNTRQNPQETKLTELFIAFKELTHQKEHQRNLYPA